MRSSLYALAGGASTALAAVRGFNYGSQGQTYDTFVSQFQVASGLVGADDFSSARLYTMIQESTANTVISAIPAAIATNTTLLLGLWASQDQAGFENELTALTNAISQYGEEFANLVVGISVGSEDLYRISPTGIAAGSGYGQEPSVLVDYIGQVRTLIQNTVLSSKPVGHVDTWNPFVNGSNSAVVTACDFLGLDEYPYYQTTDDNTIENAGSLFFEAYDRVVAVAGGKPIWITESGWPVSGPTSGDAVASTANAETYWQAVACQLISRGIDLWWYILVDAGVSPSFGVTGSLSTTPLYDLSCSVSSSSSSSASSSSTASVSSVAQATTPLSASASSTLAISNPVPTVIASVSAVSGSASPSVNGTGSGASASQAVYVTDVTTSYVTTCPVGYTLTANGSTTVLQTPSVITTTTAVQTTMTSLVGAVPGMSGASAPSGAAGATGTGAAGAGNTLASTWAGQQTPTGTGASPSTYTGSASKVGGSAVLALGVVAAVFAL